MSDTHLPGTIIRVRGADELDTALAAAQGGETIILGDGDYGEIEITARFSETVTLLSENAHGARFTELRVKEARNLTLDGLHLDYVPDPDHKIPKNAFSIKSSEAVTLRNSLLEGGDRDEPGSEADGYPTGRGLRLKDSHDVVIENNEFRTFWKAMNMAKSSDVAVVGNEFHDMRSDGFNLVASHRVQVTDNHFHDFRANRATGDHTDMIQVWTTAGAPPSDLVFARNYLDIGEGDAIQGIFINHNAFSRSVHGEDIAFENIMITDNVIVGRNVHGIGLGTTDGAVVTNNVVITPPNAPGEKGPFLAIDNDSTNVVMTGNIAANLGDLSNLPADWTVADNIRGQHKAPYLPGHYSEIFINAMSDAIHAPENLQLLPGGIADLIGAGSSLLAYDSTPETLTALARPETGAVLNEVRFDGSFSAGPGGEAAAAGAQFHWDFGDGTTGHGVDPSHVYTAPGTYTAQLTVTMPDGTSDTTMVLATISSPDLVTFDPENGVQLHLEDGTTEAVGSEAAATIGSDILTFAPDTLVKLPQGSGEGLATAESFTFSARITAEAAGTVIGAKGAFAVGITNEGELQVYMPDLPAGMAVTDGAGLLDGAPHDIAVAFHGPSDTLTLSVDGAVLETAEAPLPALSEEMGHKIIKIGATRGENGFTGTLERLDLDVNSHLYAFNAEPESPAGGMEIGTVTVDQDSRGEWHGVIFDEAIPDVRVVMGPVSAEGPQAAMARVRNVTETGFEFQIDEWDYRDGRHVTETIGWMAASEGSHTLAGGGQVMAGQVSTRDARVASVDLDWTGAEAPTVLSQVSSHNGRQAVVSRLLDVDGDGFDLRLQEDDASNGRHVRETVDWIAVGAGADAFDIVSLSLDEQWQTIPGDDGTVAVLGAMQGMVDDETAVLRWRENPDGTRAVRLQEDISEDAETDHALEQVDILTMEVGTYALFA